MTDKELLEYAAKAAGLDGQWWEKYKGEWWLDIPPQKKNDAPIMWNPLVEDGDAFRLAVKLNLGIDILKNEASATTTTDITFFEYISEGVDICAATRRAIVRAAAEIGKGGATC